MVLIPRDPARERFRRADGPASAAAGDNPGGSHRGQRPVHPRGAEGTAASEGSVGIGRFVCQKAGGGDRYRSGRLTRTPDQVLGAGRREGQGIGELIPGRARPSRRPLTGACNRAERFLAELVRASLPGGAAVRAPRALKRRAACRWDGDHVTGVRSVLFAERAESPRGGHGPDRGGGPSGPGLAELDRRGISSSVTGPARQLPREGWPGSGGERFNGGRLRAATIVVIGPVGRQRGSAGAQFDHGVPGGRWAMAAGQRPGHGAFGKLATRGVADMALARQLSVSRGDRRLGAAHSSLGYPYDRP